MRWASGFLAAGTTAAVQRIRVLIADDHPLFRDGIARAIADRPELELVGTAADGRAALEGIRTLAPDVAVLDLRMPGLDGLDVLRAVTRDGLVTRVLLLSASAEGSVAYAGIQAGASGFLTKDTDRDAICDAVTAAARGESVLDPRLQDAMMKEIRAQAPDAGPRLTAREREVLLLISSGLTAPAIAARLVVSVPTVKTHMASLYAKLGVSDRAAAVAEAMRRGLLE